MRGPGRLAILFIASSCLAACHIVFPHAGSQDSAVVDLDLLSPDSPSSLEVRPVLDGSGREANLPLFDRGPKPDGSVPKSDKPQLDKNVPKPDKNVSKPEQKIEMAVPTPDKSFKLDGGNCGNGKVEGGEECELDPDCNDPGKPYCITCLCVAK